MHWQILYWFLPIKRVIFKNLYFPIPLYSFSRVQFLEQFPSPSPFAHVPFFSLSNNPNPFSANLIRNLKPSLIYEVSLAVLFSAVMQCLWQLPVLLYIFSVSSMCHQGLYYHWSGLNTSNVPHSFDFSL